MHPPRLIVGLISFAVAATGAPSPKAASACSKIRSQLSAPSAVYFSGSEDYDAGVHHWHKSAEERPACVVEPATPAHLAAAVKVLARDRPEFAIKTGGHTYNKGHSSTTGVLIFTKLFTNITLAEDKKTVSLGVGNTWDRIYNTLEGSGVNVVGGRIPGVGVGGLITGGGYSWKTSQHALAIDHVLSYSLVLPNGSIASASASKIKDLFWALKGGLNNYGFVFAVNMSTVPQVPLVWGGMRRFDEEHLEALVNATVLFYETNTESKAQIQVGLNSDGTHTSYGLNTFYDGEAPPAGTFGMFDHLPYNASLDTQAARNFSGFVNSLFAPPGTFIAGHMPSLLSYTPGVVSAIIDEFRWFVRHAPAHSAEGMLWNFEGFTPNFLDSSKPSAYPHSPDNPLLPFLIHVSYSDGADSRFWIENTIRASKRITQAARDDGQEFDEVVYPNYSWGTTPLRELFGWNLPRMVHIKAKYDPNRLMELTGGFKVPYSLS